MSEGDARRIGLNESIFRAVNEQIETLNQNFGTGRGAMTAICECANGDCTERLEISLSEYENVRSDPRRYIVIAGHELPEYETVVGRGDGYNVVEKQDDIAVRLAEETDPRS